MLSSAAVSHCELILFSFAYQPSEKNIASPVTSPVDSSSFRLTVARFLGVLLTKLSPSSAAFYSLRSKRSFVPK